MTLVTSAKLPFNGAQPFPPHLGGAEDAGGGVGEKSIVEVDGWVRERVCFPLEFQVLHQLNNLLFSIPDRLPGLLE